MKNVFRGAAWVAVLAMFAMVDSSQAQQRRGFRSQTPRTLCDVLVLDEAKSGKVISAYDEVRQKLREQRQSSGVDFRNMSDEERREFFEKSQRDTAAEMKKALADVLSEKELAVVEEMLAKRLFMPDAELRGLRMVDLKDVQRTKIRPLAIELGKKMVPSGPRFFGPEQDEAELEKAQKAYDEAKSAFVAKVKGLLTDEQNKAWEKNIAEVNKEIEEMRERMRSFRRR